MKLGFTKPSLIVCVLHIDMHFKSINTALTTVTTITTAAAAAPQYLQALTLWAQKNDMLINTAKTKELVMGCWDHQSSSLLFTQD